MRDRAQTHRRTVGSDPLDLREARRWLARLVLEAGFSPGDAHDLAVAFGETCANVHRHAYAGRCDGRVGLRVAIAEERVVVTVDHDGEPFDPNAYAPPDLARPSENGYGLYLIRSLVDAASFESVGRGGRIVLVKRKRPRAVHGETVGPGGRHVRD